MPRWFLVLVLSFAVVADEGSVVLAASPSAPVELAPTWRLCLNIVKDLATIAVRKSASQEGRAIARKFKLEGSGDVEVTHIGQTHWVSYVHQMVRPQDSIVSIFRSQRRIIEKIRSEKPHAILVEAHGSFPPGYRQMIRRAATLFENEQLKDQPASTKAAIRFLKAFPKGLPQDLSGLTREESGLIAEVGAVDALWLSEEFNNVFGAEIEKLNVESQKRAVAPMLNLLEFLKQNQRVPILRMPQLWLTLINSRLAMNVTSRMREVFALEQAAQLAQALGNISKPKIFLVYGGGHNFSAYSTSHFLIHVFDAQ